MLQQYGRDHPELENGVKRLGPKDCADYLIVRLALCHCITRLTAFVVFPVAVSSPDKLLEFLNNTTRILKLLD